ncbi:hypothetical protein HPB51_007346 [Rhipicephalus microplus]|uniref:Uncharacterized protein n=1 Tax=Rhipicephalus microplus TaxID=6941 RepID=A0A9J6EZB3_RHIMP|nr:hypothetical protein HPB51_007346 [Rhipicephalus microplus]
MCERMDEQEENLEALKEKNENQQQVIEDLNSRLAKIQTDYDFLSEESQIIKSDAADQQRLVSSLEEQCKQLQAQKLALEEELGTVRLAASGGSSQVEELNSRLQEKERRVAAPSFARNLLVESLEAQVRTLSQEGDKARQEVAQLTERHQAAGRAHHG